MAHAKCTKETVFEAADQLLADGEKPTITRIRDVIGGGSPNDITAWMKEWRTRRQKITDAQRVPTPGNIKDQANVFLNDFIATVWDTAKSEADNKLKAERQALSEAQAELEQETGEALEMAENLNAENLALKAKIQELENVRADDQKRINTMATQAGHDQKTLTDLAKEKDRLSKELTEARTDAKEANAGAAKLSGELAELRRIDAGVKAELEDLKLKIEAFKRERDIALMEKEAAARELGNLKAQADRLQAAVDSAQAKIDALQAEARQSRDKQAVAESEAAALRGELKAMVLLAEKRK